MAKDVIHDSVKNALIKDGWTVTHEPYRIVYLDQEVYADLATERPDGNRRVVIEVKSFEGVSFISELQKSIGQYRIYRQYLELNNLNCELYLAVSKQRYEQNLSRQSIWVMIEYNEIDVLVVDIDREEVIQWIN